MNLAAHTLELAVWPLILMPLFAALVIFLSQRISLAVNVGWISSFFSVLAFAYALWLFFALGEGAIVIQTLWAWIDFGSFHLKFALVYDRLAAALSLLVAGIGALINIYSMGYIGDDSDRARYFSTLSFFLAAMLLVITAENLIVMFIGWELVGITSFLLIGYWFDNYDYSLAAKKAILFNRFADVGFILAMVVAISWGLPLSFLEMPNGLTALDSQVGGKPAVFILLGLILAAAGKSAQLPLYGWLPAAMAGPTPVSALIHSATMVTAGVFLLIRFNFLFDLAPVTVVSVAALIGLLTGLIAAFKACAQSDIKKVLAYSTVSQLGLMFLVVSCGGVYASIFHLITHAFFKAALFLSAGSVIHGAATQSMDQLGGLLKRMPVTGGVFLICALSLAGVPPLAGFYSKHALAESLISSSRGGIMFFGESIFPLGFKIISLLTGFYITRAFIKTFLGEFRLETGHLENQPGSSLIGESPKIMLLPMLILVFFVLFVGPIFDYKLAGYFGYVVSEHSWSFFTFFQPLLFPFLGIILSCFLYLSKFSWSIEKFISPSLISRSLEDSALDRLYLRLFVVPLRNFSSFLAEWFERRVICGTIYLIGELLEIAGQLARLLQPAGFSSLFWLSLSSVAFLLVFYLFL
ncbi:MAG TPA: NADH-quinone oxidoreductase subunit L [Oligoflexia bacterium]|nr:NADH-quinone oxidoreductase subunit L [Oligoflexia bacterium]HMP27588.1 NADH-quinone oxidoreductase subunit L [Oligoflexia bacterium]